VKKIISIFSFVFLAFAPAALAENNIRKVDFENFTYSAFCAGEGPFEVTVSAGEFLKKEEVNGTVENYLRFQVKSVNYGDLNNDGKEEAVVITVCNTGGTGQFSEGYIFSLENKKPVLKGRIAGGDRADGGLVSAKIEEQTLIVESYEEGMGGALCCPEFIVTNKFHLSKNNKLVDFDKPTRRQLYPVNRISFAKGAWSATFETEIEYKKRFVVSARKGQTLYVKVNRENSPVYMHKGSVDLVENEDGLTAKLNENGDFIFDVNNNNEGSLIYTITVEIK
jgi:hypothetical protein